MPTQPKIERPIVMFSKQRETNIVLYDMSFVVFIFAMNGNNDVGL